MMHVISFAKLCAPLYVNVLDALHFGKGAQVYIDAKNLGKVVVETSTTDTIAIFLYFYLGCPF
jgi:hypothetical protein